MGVFLHHSGHTKQGDSAFKTYPGTRGSQIDRINRVEPQIEGCISRTYVVLTSFSSGLSHTYMHAHPSLLLLDFKPLQTFRTIAIVK